LLKRQCLQWSFYLTYIGTLVLDGPGGDGAAGSAGEGRDGTDRSNMVEILQPGDNYPRPYENATLYQSKMALEMRIAQFQLTKLC